MSDNYRLYRQKMAQLRFARRNGALRRQLTELLNLVRECEARWALEERIERS